MHGDGLSPDDLSNVSRLTDIAIPPLREWS